ncbi:thiamine phosphate synthase [Sphingobacterium litopenaei]|uniref:Thiamine-phosphate synthase n=1 Tax=Sphingobacterium litopenaei TaxID=2763500 RepID=A0ABR7YFK4_9SPHI|nr:thiamine phosphate synthase [Sphingobacterium litopenaei]MBD1430092.1 thiamine phosphate synthase [Sphingobacterium litopenaei]
MNKISKLQYISQGNTWEEQVNNITTALNHGVKWVQLRWKEAPKEQVFDLARLVKVWCMSHQAKLIINDHVDIAKSVNADGVHLGLADMNISDAKRLLGEGKIFGGTANSLEDIYLRIQEGCDYIGLGPFRFTATKVNLSPILGLEGYKNILNHLKTLNSFPPIIAIGGIQLEDIKSLQDAGVYGVALSKYITETPQEVIKIQELL